MFEELIALIQQGKFAQVRNQIIDMNVVDIAQLFEELDTDKILVVYRLLPKEIASDVFAYMSYEQQQYIIESITDKEIKTIIDDLYLDDTVDLLEELPAYVVKRILKNTNEDKRKLINQFLNYPDYSAGSIMTIEYVDFKKEMTVKQALEHVRKTGVDKETIDVCYVIDKNRKLEGIIPIRKLILSDEAIIIDEIMDTNIISIHTYDDQEQIAALFKKYDFLAMPVVDNENRLVGIITIDDIVDIIEQENTEDFHKMAAMAPSEEEYLKTGVLTLAKHRIPWLLVLMVSATLTERIITGFETVLDTITVLSAFIPMLMDTGGNSGSQSATLIIRGLALGEVSPRDILRVVWKEFRVSIIVGFILAGVNFLRIYFIQGAELIITAIICISLFLTVVLAKVVGGALPLIAKKLRLDPAIMASPLVTTIVDTLALMAYFTMATWFLQI